MPSQSIASAILRGFKPFTVVLGALLLLGSSHAEQRPLPSVADQPSAVVAAPAARPPLPALFDDIERRTFAFFWETTPSGNGLTPDRYPAQPFSSIAAVGFALTAYSIGVERGWIGRTEAAQRTLSTLRFFHDAPQGPAATGNTGYRGFYYHFLDMRSGHRYAPWVELSSVDTGLLIMGVLFAQAYYDGDNAAENEIRELADTLYQRVEWPWLQRRAPLIAMGWFPESGFIPHDWEGYNEAMLVYLLALASPTHPVQPEVWSAWTQTYDRSWGTHHGQQHLNFAPMFGHQYSHVWIDFRGVQDAYMRKRGIDYFENSRRATYAQRAYAIENPRGWQAYGADIWGLTASDGPQITFQTYRGELREFRHYSARGIGYGGEFDDGTIAPTAAIASLPFAPEIVIPATTAMHQRFGKHIYSTYGFLDAFNPSFTFDVPVKNGRVIENFGWVGGDYIGIDQGPILAMIANYRNDFVWRVMQRSKYLRIGLQRAGFLGGWMESHVAPTPAPISDEAAPAPARHLKASAARIPRAAGP